MRNGYISFLELLFFWSPWINPTSTFHVGWQLFNVTDPTDPSNSGKRGTDRRGHTHWPRCPVEVVSIAIFFWCILRREWMGCWGLLGLLFIVMKWIILPKIPCVKRTSKQWKILQSDDLPLETFFQPRVKIRKEGTTFCLGTKNYHVIHD